MCSLQNQPIYFQNGHRIFEVFRERNDINGNVQDTDAVEKWCHWRRAGKVFQSFFLNSYYINGIGAVSEEIP